MKSLLLPIAMLLVFTTPVYAESAYEVCAEEAHEAGITNQEEIDFYIKECVSQINTEMESDSEKNESEIENKTMETPPVEES